MLQRKRFEDDEVLLEVGRKEELPVGSLPRVEGLLSKSIARRQVRLALACCLRCHVPNVLDEWNSRSS